MISNFGANAAIEWLLENTPDTWCWDLGYHPTHSSLHERRPGSRRLTLNLIAPNLNAKHGDSPLVSVFEERVIESESESYLTMAKRAKSRVFRRLAGERGA